MDRRLKYVGQVPLAEDWLQPQRDAIVALGEMLTMLLGMQTVVSGMTVAPTQPQTLAVTVGAGTIYSPGPIDGTAYGVLPADTRQIMKQGILASDVTLPVVPPGTPGDSRSYLVQVAFSEDDTDPLVLPYFNSANPAQAYSGPGNTGQQQNTRRRGRAIVQLKAGAPSPTGTQAAPAPDLGYLGLAIVTVANGAASVTAGSIQNLPAVPRPASNLLLLRPGFSNVGHHSTPGSINWVVPPTVRRVRVRCWGGGGGGGSSNASPPYGSGGGPGGYAEKIIDVTPGQVIPLTVGGGGVGGIAPNPGSPGNTTSFGSYVSATGGTGGSAGSTPGTGGIGVGGDLNLRNNTGFPGYAIGGGVGDMSGAGGDAPGGGGQGGAGVIDAVGRVGSVPGGGGGGAAGTSRNGGAGAHGMVIVEW